MKEKEVNSKLYSKIIKDYVKALIDEHLNWDEYCCIVGPRVILQEIQGQAR